MNDSHNVDASDYFQDPQGPNPHPVLPMEDETPDCNLPTDTHGNSQDIARQYKRASPPNVERLDGITPERQQRDRAAEGSNKSISVSPTAKKTSLSQLELPNACRGLALSGSGSKSELMLRISQQGINTVDGIKELHRQFIELGPDINKGNGRGRAPNWAKRESARLYHVIAGPTHAVTLALLYQRIQSRAEFDIQRKDPFVDQFCRLFNDPSFCPAPPPVRDGITDDTLHSLDASKVVYRRQGQLLKKKWTRLRSLYTVALRNFQASGQEDRDAFPEFTRGDDVLCYIHCVFYDHPSLEAVIRALPLEAQVESSLETRSQDARENDQFARKVSRKRRRETSTDVLAAAITSLASNQNDDKPIVLQTQDVSSATETGVLPELDRAAKIGSTVSTLMDFEQNFLKSMESVASSCPSMDKSKMITSLQHCLETVQGIIDEAMLKM